MSMSQWDGSSKPINWPDAASGWEVVADPMYALFKGLKEVKKDVMKDMSKTTLRFGNGNLDMNGNPIPGVFDSMGNFYPQQGTGHKIQVHFSGGAGGGQSGMGSPGIGSSAGGGAYNLTPEVLLPVGQATPTAGLTAGITPESLGVTGAGASGSISGAGAGYGKYLKGAIGAYSALQQSKDRQAMAGNQQGNVTRTPYQAQMLNHFIPYILSEALNIFKKRQGTAKRQAGSIDPLLAMLGQYLNK